MFQIGGQFDNPVSVLFYYVPFLLLMFYGQRISVWIMLNQASGSVKKLSRFQETSRIEAIDYIKNNFKLNSDPTNRINELIEYFTIMPVNLDPSGIMNKIEHVTTLQDERLKEDIQRITGSKNEIDVSKAGNMVEIATALNLMHKVVRHLFLIGKRTKSTIALVQLQIIMPMIMDEANALVKATEAFRKAHPIGDGIGPMVVSRFMIGKRKTKVSKETLLAQNKYKMRNLSIIKAGGPIGTVGKIGEAINKIVNEMNTKINIIIMVDAALKLEGEKTGEIAEGAGAAIGGIGVERFKIEEIATENNIPLHAIVIKQSNTEAITSMKKEIAESADEVEERIKMIIEEETEKGENVLLVGVGNTIGVGQ